MSSVSSVVRLPSVFCWRTSRISIMCLAAGRFFSGFPLTGSGTSPRHIDAWMESELARYVRLAGGSTPSGEAPAVCVGSTSALFTGGLALTLDLGLPIFVDNNFFCGILCHDRQSSEKDSLFDLLYHPGCRRTSRACPPQQYASAVALPRGEPVETPPSPFRRATTVIGFFIQIPATQILPASPSSPRARSRTGTPRRARFAGAPGPRSSCRARSSP